MLAPLAGNPVADRVGYVLTRPLVAYGLASATLIAWHLPALYEAALYSDPLHLAEHAPFFAAALLAWWPVLGSLPRWPRIAPVLLCLYSFALTTPAPSSAPSSSFPSRGSTGPTTRRPASSG